MKRAGERDREDRVGEKTGYSEIAADGLVHSLQHILQRTDRTRDGMCVTG